MNRTVDDAYGLTKLTEKLASAALRIHWALSSRTFIGPLYTRLVDSWNAVAEYLRFTSWRLTKAPPSLNRITTQRYLSEYYDRLGVSKPDHPADPLPGRLLVHLAFHFKGSRLKYALETIEQLKRLPFDGLKICVDTNSDRTAPHVKHDDVTDVKIHSDLEHPFLLTWSHRPQLKAAIDDFEYFMYIEDDIFIPADAIQCWRKHSDLAKRFGYLPGFLRVEVDRRGRLISSDFLAPAPRSLIIDLEGKPFLLTPYPYAAFWLYDKETMRRFMASPVFADGYMHTYIRERAAMGFSYVLDGKDYRSQVVLPLTPDLRVDPSCYVFHMPSNYGRRVVKHPAGLGTIAVEDVVSAN